MKKSATPHTGPAPADVAEFALRDILTALAKPLLSVGVTPSDFCDVAKVAFVHASADLCRMRNGRTNDSRIAVMTSLSRQDVARLRQSRTPAFRTRQRAARILDGWTSDRRFSSQRGKPMTLRMDAPLGGFPDLVRRYGGDVPPRAVVEELKRLKAVRLEGQKIFLLKKDVLPDPAQARAIRVLASFVASAARVLSVDGATSSGSAFSVRVRARDRIEAVLINRKIDAVLGAALKNIEALDKPRKRRRQGAKESTVRVISLIERAQSE